MKIINKIVKLLLILPTLFSKPHCVALIRTDNIGDYILFRNFLPFIRQSEKYKSRKIILIGNSMWKELAEYYDKKFVDSFFWIDTTRFNKDKIYQLKILWRLNQLSISELINTVHSRTWLINKIGYLSRAKLKITCYGDAINLESQTKVKSDLLFDNIIPSSTNFEFEFYRNRTFVERLNNETIELQQTCFKGIIKEKKPLQILIFPSAQSVLRRWDTTHFATLISSIHHRLSKFEFLILGNNNDIPLGEAIIAKVPNSLKIVNLCGKTSLIDLVEFISESILLISNETSAVHIAAATKTQTICISNGNHFGRFNPYPKSMKCPITYFYPNDSFLKKNNWEELTSKFQFSSDLDINKIEPEIMLPTIISILSSKKNN